MLRIIDGVIYMVRGDDDGFVVGLSADGEPTRIGELETLTLTVRKEPDESSPIIFETTTAPGSNLVVVRHADTADAEYGEYSADIQLMTVDGKRKTVWPVIEEGNIPKPRSANLKNFVILPEVTMK